MGAEFLLYGYGLVCASMLVFNLLYSFYLRAGDRRLTRREDRLRQRVEEQLEQLRQLPPGAPQEVQASHLAWMRRRLSHVNNLLAFDQLLAAWAAGDAACQAYLSQLQPVFLYLATVYVKRESTQAAYYCYFLAKNKLRSHMEMDTFQQGDALLPQAGQLLLQAQRPQGPVQLRRARRPGGGPHPAGGRGGPAPRKGHHRGPPVL